MSLILTLSKIIKLTLILNFRTSNGFIKQIKINLAENNFSADISFSQTKSILIIIIIIIIIIIRKTFNGKRYFTYIYERIAYCLKSMNYI